MATNGFNPSMLAPVSIHRFWTSYTFGKTNIAQHWDRCASGVVGAALIALPAGDVAWVSLETPPNKAPRCKHLFLDGLRIG